MLFSHILAMENSKGLNHSHEAFDWGLKGENSSPKPLVCVQVSVQADGTHGCYGEKKTNKHLFSYHDPRRGAGEPPESQAPMLWFR